MEFSTNIKQRFQLQSMSAAWETWFDSEWETAKLLGEFEHPFPPDRLCAEASFPPLAGMIPPDCIPVVGNGYGDWICVRVTAKDSLGELIHWYHGGGDWIPVGENLSQAMLHDFVDSYRPKSTQMLRGAIEIAGRSPTTIDPAKVLESRWLVEHSASINDIDLNSVVVLLGAGRHADALRVLHQHEVAYAAVSCDLIEHAIATPLSGFASPKHASACGLEWATTYLRLLFDFHSSPEDSQTAFLSTFGDAAKHVTNQQDWLSAGQIARNVLCRRNDLGWARDVAGWSEQRQGNYDTAIRLYRQSENSSTFSDQAVRLRTHWFPSTEPNFSTAQLNFLSPDGEHVQAPTTTADWIEQGNALQATRQFGAAYDAFYRAGWCTGFRSLAECSRLLQLLVDNARAAGWSALAATAAAHLEVVRKHRR